jgi:cellulase
VRSNLPQTVSLRLNPLISHSMFVTLSTLAALCALPQALAHGGVLSYNIGGKIYNGWQPYNSPSGQTSIQRPWSTYDPITDAKSSNIACNDDGSSGALQLTASAIPAGSSITAYWNQVWPHPQGPMLTYLANCGGSTCTGVNAKNLKWFKIDHAGLLSGTIGNGKWASGKMIDNNSSWTSTIPSTVPAGNYLIRFETIALHSLPAQFYPECAQIQITGSGSRAPTSSELVSFPGAYSNSDPGLSVNLYSTDSQTNTHYVIPGPPLYGSGGSTGSTGGTPTTTAPSGPTTTASSGTVNQYGQCGGIGWTGATACISPYTCHVVNDYYSQCT